VDTVINAFEGELEKIARMDSEKKKRWLRRGAGAAGVIAGGAGAAFAGRAGLRAARGAYKRILEEASQSFADKLEVGVRRGVQQGFDQGTANLKSSAPGMADQVVSQIRPQVDEIIEQFAQKARSEAPGIGEAVAEGFKGSIKKRLPWGK